MPGHELNKQASAALMPPSLKAINTTLPKYVYPTKPLTFRRTRERVERSGTGSLSLCRVHRIAEGRVIHQVLRG